MTLTGIVGRPDGQIVPLVNTTKRTKQIELVAGTDITCPQAGFTVVKAWAVFFADSAGNWWATLSTEFSITSAAVSSVAVTFPNLVFSSYISQALAASWVGVAELPRALAGAGTSVITFVATSGSVTVAGFRATNTIRLNAEPLTYTVAGNMESPGDVTAYIPMADAATAGLLSTSAQTKTGVMNFQDGIRIGGNETIITYDEGSFTAYCVDGTNKSTGVIVYYVVFGKKVTLNFQLTALQSTVANRYITSTDSPNTYTWPSALTPARTQIVLARGYYNNASLATPGLFAITAAGQAILYKDTAGTTWGTNNYVNGMDECTITYSKV